MGIGPLVCINNLLITPAGKGLSILVSSDFFSNLETIIMKAILVPVNSFLF